MAINGRVMLCNVQCDVVLYVKYFVTVAAFALNAICNVKLHPCIKICDVHVICHSSSSSSFFCAERKLERGTCFSAFVR